MRAEGTDTTRRNVFAAALFVALGLLAPPAHAQTRPGWEAGLEAFYYRYEEPGRGFVPFNTLDEQHGVSPGLTGSYTAKAGPVFLRLEGSASATALSYSSPISGNHSGVFNTIGEARGLVIDDVSLSNGVTLSPYAGAGYRVLLNGLDGGRLDQYVYIPVGATLGIAAGRFVLKPSLEYDVFIHGWQDTYLSHVGYSNDLHFDQSSGYGIRGSLLAEVGTEWGLASFGPFVRYWNIRTSNVQTATGPACFGQPNCSGGPTTRLSFVEPNNDTVEAGLTLRLAF